MVPQNHQLQQRNSQFHSDRLYISFSDVNLISAPILPTCLNWAQLGSLQRFAISSTWCGRLLRDGNENINPQNSLIEKGMGLQRSQHLNGKHLWPKYRFINLWTILCDISLTLQGSVSLKAEIYISLCENIDRSAVWSEIPSRLAKRLELHQDLPFCGKKKQKASHLKNFQNIRIAIWS